MLGNSYKRKSSLTPGYLKKKIRIEVMQNRITNSESNKNLVVNEEKNIENNKIKENVDEFSKINNSSGNNNDCYEESSINSSLQINKEENILKSLSSWCIRNKITHTSMNDLLAILRDNCEMSFLPKDARTLLNTPVKINKIVPCVPGSYVHIGVENSLKYLLKNLYHILEDNIIVIDINIDGLPLSRSSSSQLWPILGLLRHTSNNKMFPPFIIGIYHGQSKPKTTSFLLPFVEEMKSIFLNGIIFNDTLFKVKIRAVICDAPARAFISQVNGHTAAIGCGKCTIEGEYLESRICFPYKNKYTKRTDTSFANRNQEEFHKGISPLEILEIGMVSQFPLDYLHLICLGVTKKLLLLWMKGPLKCRFSKRNIENVSSGLLRASFSQPVEFNRKLRSLDYLGNFKGTEYRTFLLYAGPVVLKNNLSAILYKNFLALHCGIRILCDSKLCHSLNRCADDLLNYFVRSFESIYGIHFVSYNVHNLLHLASDCLTFGPLDNFSAFPFESFMKTIKNLSTRKGNSPLQQIHNRISEIYSTEFETHTHEFKVGDSILRKPIRIESGQIIYKEVKTHKYVIKTDNANKWLKLKSGDIIAFDHAVNCNGKILIFAGSLMEKSDFFVTPIKSSYLGIIESSGKENVQKYWAIEDIEYKIFAIEQDNTRFVFFPMIDS